MKRKLKQQSLIALSIFITLVITITAWSVIERFELDARTQLGQYLTTQLNTTHQGVTSWLKEHQAAVRVWANTPEVRQAASALLAESNDRLALLESPAQTHLRGWLRPVLTGMSYQGYFIIGPDKVNLASSRDRNIGQKNLLTTQEAFFQKIWSGKSAVSMPEESEVPLPDKNGTLQENLPTMFVGAPVLDESGEVIAAFTFGINPADDFSTILQQGRIGETGETYAFDRQGRFLSNSRFDDQLHNIGLINNIEESILNIQIRDPGINLIEGEGDALPEEQWPLTQMASSAIAGNSGMNLDGYRDYRGVPVVGTWLWDDKLGLGISSEIDVDGAYRTLRATRYTIITLTLLLILLLAGVVTIQLINRQRRQAELELNSLKELNENVIETAPVRIHVVDKEFNVLIWNRIFESYSTLRKGDVIGKNLFDVLPGLKKQGWQEVYEKVISTDEAFSEQNYKHTRTVGPKKGEVEYQNINIQPLRKGGGVVGALTMVEDITERKQAEKALQRSEVLERLATGASLNKILTALVVNAEKHDPKMLCSVLLLDKGGKHLRHGAAPSLPDFYNDAIDGLEIGPDVCSCGAAAYSGERVIVEEIMSHPNWINYRELVEKAGLRSCWSEPVISSSGDILGTLAIYSHESRTPTQSDLDFIQDSARLAGIAIERKQAEEALRSSEQKFRSVVENVPIGISISTPEGDVKEVNTSVLNIFGYDSKEEFLNTPAKEHYLNPKEREKFVAAHKKGLVKNLELEYKRKDGSAFWGSVTSTVVSTGACKTVFINAFEDITERKQAEEALKESEQKFRSVVENIGIGVSLISPDMEILALNKQMKEWFPDIDVTKSPLCFRAFNNPPRETECSYCPTNKTLVDGQVHESITETPAGDQLLNYRVVSSPIKDESGKVVAAIEMVEDITERKQAEEAMREERDKAQRYLDTVEAIIVSLDANGQITLINRKGCELLGYKENELLGKDWFATCLPQPEGKEVIYKAFREIMAGNLEGVDYYENSIITHSGKKRLIAWHNSSFRDADGNIIGVLSAGEDISDRKQTEEALRDSEEKFRGIFNNAQVALFRTRTSDGKLLECNERLAHMFGYKDRNDCISHFVSSEHYLDADTRERMLSELKKRGEINNFEAQLSRKDGVAIWMRYSAKLYPERGYIEGVATDITEQREAEEQLRASEAELKGILDSLQDIYYRTDSEGRVIRLSPSVEQIIGYRAEEMIGNLITSYWRHPDDRQKMLEVMQASDGSVNGFEAEVIHKDGSIGWVSTNAHFYHDEQGKIAGVEGTIRDVTQRKHVEVVLRESEANLRRAQSVAHVGSWDLDIPTNILLWSDESYRILGIPGTEVLTYEKFLEHVHPDDVAQLNRAWEAALGGEEYDEEHRIVVDGEIRWVHEKCYFEFDHEGNAVRALGTVQDITERKEIEAKAMQHLEEVAHYSRLSTVGEMTTEIAHELNQPLTTIASYGDTLSRLLQSGSWEMDDMVDGLQDITQQALRAGKIIHRLRGLVRKKQSHKNHYDANRLIDGVLQLITIDARQHNVEVVSELAGTLPKVWVDKILLEQVLLNLMHNAIEAMSSEAKTDDKVSERRLTIGTRLNDNGQVEIEVSDTGPGIANEQIEKIFEPFYTTKQQGMGMGLSICRSIVEENGGLLWADSQPGEGASFRLTMPVAYQRENSDVS